MNSEKQVKDITQEELAKITKSKEDGVAYRLKSLLEQRVRNEAGIKKAQEALAETNAKIIELEGLTVEEAYALIHKNDNYGTISNDAFNYFNQGYTVVCSGN